MNNLFKRQILCKNICFKTFYSQKQTKSSLNVENNAKIVTNNECFEHKVKTIISEYNDLKSIDLKTIPDSLTAEDINELVLIERKDERKSYLKYLYLRGIYRQKSVLSKSKSDKRLEERDVVYHQIQRLLEPKTRLLDKNNHLIYGLWRNSLFPRISRSQISNHCRHRLRTGALFGPKLCIDLSFDKLMTRFESKKLIEELRHISRLNKTETKEPFDLCFFNITADSIADQLLRGSGYEELIRNYVELSSDSYLDRFSRQTLIYLTPDASEVMTVFDCNMVYIIGGFVDKYNPSPLALETANKESIVSMRLPIDHMTSGYVLSNKLYLPQVFQVLNIMKDFSDNYESVLETTVRKWYKNRRKIV